MDIYIYVYTYTYTHLYSWGCIGVYIGMYRALMYSVRSVEGVDCCKILWVVGLNS